MKWNECKKLIAHDYSNTGGKEISCVSSFLYYGMILLC